MIQTSHSIYLKLFLTLSALTLSIIFFIIASSPSEMILSGTPGPKQSPSDDRFAVKYPMRTPIIIPVTPTAKDINNRDRLCLGFP